MAKRAAEEFDDDDYFTEPNYDKLSDEELDDLYHFGEIRSAPKPQKRKTQLKTVASNQLDDKDVEWLDMDHDIDLDLDLDLELDGEEDLTEDN